MQTREDGKDWYCIECHLAGDVVACRSCFHVFHAECSTKAKQKLDVFKLSTANKGQFDDSKTKSSEAIKDVILPEIPFEINESSSKDLDLVELDMSLESVNSVDNEVESQMKKNRNSFVYDESLCYICNLKEFDIECGMDKEELNHLLGFLLLRIKSWVN